MKEFQVLKILAYSINRFILDPPTPLKPNLKTGSLRRLFSDPRLVSLPSESHFFFLLGEGYIRIYEEGDRGNVWNKIIFLQLKNINYMV